MRRLIDLTAIADPIVAVDNVMHVTELGAAMESTGRTLRIVIEVDIGMHRAGVLPGAPVVTLARAVAAEKGCSHPVPMRVALPACRSTSSVAAEQVRFRGARNNLV